MRQLLLSIFYRLCRLLPVEREKILLFSYYGSQYGGSPKYIGKYMQEHTAYRVIWAFVDMSKHDDYEGERVKFGHLKYYYHLATAGTIITNYRMLADFRKRSGQYYIQTWHSSLRLKQIEKDAKATLPQSYLSLVHNDSSQIDLLLAGSRYGKEIFERAFWYDGEISGIGTPQCDILFEDRSPYKKRVCSHYGLNSETKIAMYAPTFRKDNDMSAYNINTEMVLTSLEKRFGGDWVLLMRLHPHLINQKGIFAYNERVIQATDYDDVQELLAATDFLISDYSAIMFDYSVTHRPCMLYVPDLENYVAKDRNLYFDIEALPFDKAKNNEQLVSMIENFDEKQYKEKIMGFMEQVGSFDDGYACARVCRKIMKKDKKRIGYTTGVYDMFHIGHLNILRGAKEQCDYLIVGVSTDELVEKEKSKTPIIPFQERCQIVESIKYTDEVVPQVDKNKMAAWERLHFDVMFVGSDWQGTPQWKEYERQFAEVGVEIVYLKHTDGISSSILREKMNK